MLLDIMIARVRFYRIQRIVDRGAGEICVVSLLHCIIFPLDIRKSAYGA